MSMRKKCLAYVIHAIHFISTITAIKQLNSNIDIDIYILVFHPYLSDEDNYEIYNIIKKISSKNIQIKNIIYLKSNAHNLFIKTFKNYNFNEIYYTVDFVTDVHPLLFELFPEAKRICVGDALGNVYEKDVVLSYIKYPSDPNKVINNYKNNKNYFRVIKERLKKYFPTKNQPQNNHVFPDFRPHEAALILPVDQSGNFLKGIPLTVCRKELFIGTMNQCAKSCVELNKYVSGIIKKYKKKKYIMLTENIAEGNFIEYNKEIEMWCYVIKKYCDKDSVIFLKSHPGEVFNRNKLIRKKLGKDYCVCELKRNFKRYPIELWRDLVLASTIICMSYPVLSLKYIYNVDVLNPMDDSFIEKWFPEWIWNSYKNSTSLYKEPLKRLPNWDGKGVLYSGERLEQI